MTTVTTQRTRPAAARHPAVRTMWIGVALTVLATVAPLVDLVTTGTIEGHVREAYPNWGDDLVGADTTAITVGLLVLGALGLAGWAVSIWATARSRRWARGLASTLFVLGAVVVLFLLTAPAGPYDRMVPVGIGLITALPCVAGLVTVAQLWQRSVPG